MRILLAAVALLTLAACGSGDDVAVDHGPQEPGAHAPMPTEVPAAEGLVRTRDPATVMDTGRPELCLGVIAESWPPQCGGPPIAGWDWAAYDGRFERQGDTRWGEFVVVGRWDGTTLAVEEAVPAALHDAPPTERPSAPEPEVELDEEQLAAIAARIGNRLAGAQGAYVTDGQVLVDVTYDDGSLQAWADEELGKDVVVVTSALVDAE